MFVELMKLSNCVVLCSNFGAQVVTWIKGVEEIGAFVAARSGFSLWDLWDLDKVSGKGWDCCKFL